MADLQSELQACRLLLSLLTEKLAYLEGQLFPTAAGDMPGDSHAFQRGASDGMGDSPAFLPANSDGLRDGRSFLTTGNEGMGDSPRFQSGENAGMRGRRAFQSGEDAGNKLAQLLKAGEMKKLSPAQVLHAAKFLYRIYDGGEVRNPHPSLAKLTGMSVSGIGKLVMSLRRRSLIETVGFQRYKLTEKAMGYLQQVAG